MSVRITSDGARLEIVVRQGIGSLFAFVAMALVIGLAASARGRATGDPSWIWWPIGLGLAAVAWSLYAMGAEERFMFDGGAGTFAVSRRTFLGAQVAASGSLSDFRSARPTWIGYEQAVRGIEMQRRDRGTVTLPLRSTDLTEDEQSRIAAAIDSALRAARATAAG